MLCCYGKGENLSLLHTCTLVQTIVLSHKIYCLKRDAWNQLIKSSYLLQHKRIISWYLHVNRHSVTKYNSKVDSC